MKLCILKFRDLKIKEKYNTRNKIIIIRENSNSENPLQNSLEFLEKKKFI